MIDLLTLEKEKADTRSLHFFIFRFESITSSTTMPYGYSHRDLYDDEVVCFNCDEVYEDDVDHKEDCCELLDNTTIEDDWQMRCPKCIQRLRDDRTECSECKRRFCELHGDTDHSKCCGRIYCGESKKGKEGCKQEVHDEKERLKLKCGHYGCVFYYEGKRCRACDNTKKDNGEKAVFEEDKKLLNEFLMTQVKSKQMKEELSRLLKNPPSETQRFARHDGPSLLPNYNEMEKVSENVYKLDKKRKVSS